MRKRSNIVRWRARALARALDAIPQEEAGAVLAAVPALSRLADVLVLGEGDQAGVGSR